jgi:phage virion morphogenesis protein
MISIKIGDEKMQKQLDDLIKRGVDMTQAMQRIAGIMADEVEENFAQEGRPKWKGLAKSTIKAREKKGNWPGMILQVRGQLAASIQSDADKLGAEVGTNKEYAAIHNFGGEIKIKGRKGIVRLRVDSKGNLLRQGTTGSLKNLSVFAASHHKRTKEVKFKMKKYSITMPKREFLKLSDRAQERIRDIVAAYAEGRAF